MTKAAQSELIAELTAALKAALPVLNGYAPGSAEVFIKVRAAIAKSEQSK